MTHLTILHETRYSYERPVGFGAHRLLLRPRDSHAIRVVEASLTMSSPGEVRTERIYFAIMYMYTYVCMYI